MPEDNSSEVKGLQLWLPSDSFNQEQNLEAMGHAMANFKVLSILHIPSDNPIYCAGNGLIHQIVTEQDVNDREQDLRHALNKPTSSILPELVLEENQLNEEARFRELHLKLGRTSLLLAVAAQTAEDFKSATDDLQQVFAITNKRIHTHEQLAATHLRKEGLIYMLVQAARKHKTFTRDSATKLVDTMDAAILPMDGGRFVSPARSWKEARGKGFIDRVSYAYSPPKSPKQKKRSVSSKPKKMKLTDEAKGIKREKKILASFVYDPYPRTAKFLTKLAGRSDKLSTARLKVIHDDFLGESPKQSFNISPESRVETARFGVEGYLERFSVSPSDTAGQVLHYLTRQKGLSRKGIFPILVIGNLLTAKVNSSGGFNGEKKDRPETNNGGVLQSFLAIRYVLEHEHMASDQDKMYGNLVEKYIDAAFDEEDELDYEIEDAPEGYVKDSDFAKTLRVSKSTLKKIMEENPLELQTYKFKKSYGKGLSPAYQELIKSIVESVRPPDAPDGYVKVAEFARTNNIPQTVVERLIDEFKIAVTKHSYGAVVSRTLSPEAQEELAKVTYW
jgi:hypothetical protein